MDMFDYGPSSAVTVERLRKPTGSTTTIRPTQQAQTLRSSALPKCEGEGVVQVTIKSLSVLEREIVARELEIDDDDYRHWSPASQPYATAEVLLQYLSRGWECMNEVAVKTFRCVSSRCVEVYAFEISKGHERLCVPVVSNPIILRFIRQRGLAVTSCEDNL